MIAGPPTLDTYLALITSEHRDKPKFMAQVAEEVQPYVDLMQTLWSMITIFSTTASGDQLDKFAQWVGVTRNLPIPLTGVFFSFDEGPGFDEGTWVGPADDPSYGLTVLPDDSFRILVSLFIAMNNWDGTIPGAYALWDSVMSSDFGILIQDNQDMSMLVVFTGAIESVITKALITEGFFNLRPAGVRINLFGEPSVADTPCFGFDAQSTVVAGFDTGCWIQPLS
jgi:hypothetical protein